MANSPMTTLSIGGVMPSSTYAAKDQQSFETILRLKSWDQETDAVTSDYFLQGMMESSGQESGSQSSSKGLKRKRTPHGSLSARAHEGRESGIVLGLGQMDSTRGAQEDSVTFLGLGQSDNHSGNYSGSPSVVGDESGHSGTAAAVRLRAEGRDPGAVEPGVLLRLGSMGDSPTQTNGGEGLGWHREGRLFDNQSEKHAGTHLGLAPSQNGYVEMIESPNSNYNSGGGMLLGLGHGEKSMGSRCYSHPGAHVPVVDEGSSSARLACGGYMPSLLMSSPILPSAACDQSQRDVYGYQHMEEDLVEHDLLMTLRASTSGGTTSTSGASGHSDRAPKVCKFRGCGKGPRGASGLCIAHGGGRRCQKHACNKGAEGRTVYCKAHGGGRRCQNLGCTKSAEGKTDFCIGHGGGRRCSHEGCDKAARGRSGLCIRHGGGKRCQVEGCTKSAEGYSGLCISHGGGRRCQFAGCSKGAQGSTMFCKAHGGGKRCIIQDCNKGAEGSTPLCKGHGGGKRCLFDGGGICTKSVHGGTLYCVAHGGGKRCAVEGCGKSARGRTDFCVRHGGGKRCKVEGCGKSAQGSTDFCKAHGGGKRCQWGVEGSNFGDTLRDSNGDRVAGTPCDKFARGKTGLCAAHSALVSDRRVHGGCTIGSAVTPGLAPGLFRGLVSGSGQSRPGTNASTSSGAMTAAAGSTRPVSSGSDKVIRSGYTEGADFPSSNDKSWERHAAPDDTPRYTTRAPIEIWASGGSGLSESSLSMSSQGYSASKDSTHHSISETSGSMHGPFSGNLLNVYQPGTSSGADMNNYSFSSAPGLEGVAVSTAGFDLSTVGLARTSSVSPQSAPFHQPHIPPQVLVPLSMQKKDNNTLSSKPKNGRPPRPRTSTADEGVFNMDSLSLPEGRVHGGGHMPSLPEGRVHGGGLMTALPEGRVHGGAIMALLSKEAAGAGAEPMNTFNLGMGLSRSLDNVRSSGYSHVGSRSCAVGNGLLNSESTLERSSSLGIDVGQFLATGVDLN